MDLGPFLMVDALFLVGLTWWFWTRSPQRGRRSPGQATENPFDRPDDTKSPAPALPVERILFEGNTSALSTTAIADLDRLALWLKSSTARLEITGSADDTGHPTKNRQLARARSAIAQRALLAHGIAANRLAVVVREPGRGHTERERQLLRCVTFRSLAGN